MALPVPPNQTNVVTVTIGDETIVFNRENMTASTNGHCYTSPYYEIVRRDEDGMIASVTKIRVGPAHFGMLRLEGCNLIIDAYPAPHLVTFFPHPTGIPGTDRGLLVRWKPLSHRSLARTFERLVPDHF